MTYSEKEKACAYAFAKGEPFWHLCTPGNVSGLIFKTQEDMRFAMTLMAVCAYEYPDVAIYAFAIMNNHIHWVVSSSYDQLMALFNTFKTRLLRYCSNQGRGNDLSSFNCKIIPIIDLRTLRNTIAYVNRNGYVVNPDCTPFSYRWGTCRYFFNDIPMEHTFGELTVRKKREICRSKNWFVPDHCLMDCGYPAPVSYCRIKESEAMFRDAHHYMSLIAKNVESYSEIALELSDSDFLTDEELYNQLVRMCLSEYGSGTPSKLPQKDRIELARKIHFQFGAKNNQIRRMLALSQYEVDALFPLTASHDC